MLLHVIAMNALAALLLLILHVESAWGSPLVLEKQDSEGDAGITELCKHAKNKHFLDALVPIGGGKPKANTENVPLRFTLDCTTKEIMSCAFAHSWADPNHVLNEHCDSPKRAFFWKTEPDAEAKRSRLRCSKKGGCFVSIDDGLPLLTKQEDKPKDEHAGINELCEEAGGLGVLDALVPIGGGVAKANIPNLPIIFRLDCSDKKIRSCGFSDSSAKPKSVTVENCGFSNKFEYKAKGDAKAKQYRLKCSPKEGCFVQAPVERIGLPVLETLGSAIGEGKDAINELCEEAGGQDILDAAVPIGGGTPKSKIQNLPIKFKLDCDKKQIKSCSFSDVSANPKSVTVDDCGFSKVFQYKAAADSKNQPYRLQCLLRGGCYVQASKQASGSTVLQHQSSKTDGETTGLMELCTNADNKGIVEALVPIGGGPKSSDKPNVQIKYEVDCGKQKILSCTFSDPLAKPSKVSVADCSMPESFKYKSVADAEEKSYRLFCYNKGGCYIGVW